MDCFAASLLAMTENKERLMAWYAYIAWFFAGAFLAHAIPHIVQGICGNRFQTPFASPPGVGESSAFVNVVWGFFNVAIGGALLYSFLPPLPPPWPLAAVGVMGALVTALWLANHFGTVRNSPRHP